MKKRMPAKAVKAGWYDPADYIMVHKEHYADLLYRATTRIEAAPYKISVDGPYCPNRTCGIIDGPFTDTSKGEQRG